MMTERTFGEIAEQIRMALQASGKMPSERALAEKLDIKRHQLRKVLQEMRDNGELPEPPQRRKQAREHPSGLGADLVSITNPLEVLELRFILEPGFARLATLRGSELELRHIQKTATTPPDSSSGEVDLKFHLAIAQAARNNLAIEFYRVLRQVGVDARIRVARQSSGTCPKRIAQRDAEHRKIADAISLRDPDAAEEAMREHLESVRKRINERTNAFAA